MVARKLRYIPRTTTQVAAGDDPQGGRRQTCNGWLSPAPAAVLRNELDTSLLDRALDGLSHHRLHVGGGLLRTLLASPLRQVGGGLGRFLERAYQSAQDRVRLFLRFVLLVDRALEIDQGIIGFFYLSHSLRAFLNPCDYCGAGSQCIPLAFDRDIEQTTFEDDSLLIFVDLDSCPSDYEHCGGS